MDHETRSKIRGVVLGLAGASVLFVVGASLLVNHQAAPPGSAALPPGQSQGPTGSGEPLAETGQDHPTVNHGTASDKAHTDTHVEQVWTGKTITTPPKPFEQTAEADVIRRFFSLLSQSKVNGQQVDVPVGYSDVVEVLSKDMPTLGPGMIAFQQDILAPGNWDMVGNPVEGALSTAKLDGGRTVQRRAVMLLIRQRTAPGEVYYQINFEADFLRYQDGRALIAQGSERVAEINKLDPALVPKYKTAYGVR